MASSAIELLRLASLGVVATWLVGCEARLNMESVGVESVRPIHRFDNFQAAAKSNDGIVVVGDGGTVLTGSPGDDSEIDWQRTELEGSPSLIDVTSCPNGSVVALSFENDIWVKAESGNSWVRKKIGGDDAPQALTCDAHSIIWVVGEFSSIRSTKDFGANWAYFSFDEDLIFTTVQFLESGTAFVLGEFGTVAMSTNGGSNWNLLPSIPEEFYPQDAYFANDQTGWAVGLRGQVRQTLNAGLSWVSMDTDTDISLFNVIKSSDDVFAVGERGLVLKRTELGNWITVPQASEVFTHLRAAISVESCQLLVAGGGGRVYNIDICGAQQ